MEVINYTKERYLSYISLQNSVKQHKKLKEYFKNYFTAGDDRYPNNKQVTLILLYKYTNPIVIQQTNS